MRRGNNKGQEMEGKRKRWGVWGFYCFQLGLGVVIMAWRPAVFSSAPSPPSVSDPSAKWLLCVLFCVCIWSRTRQLDDFDYTVTCKLLPGITQIWQPQDFVDTLFDLSQFCSSSVSCLCAITDQLFIDLFLWEDEVCTEWFVVTAWAGQPELNARKTFQLTGRRFLLFNAFYESSTSWWSTSHSVLTARYGAASVSVLNQRCFPWLSISQDTAAFGTQPPARSILQKGKQMLLG